MTGFCTPHASTSLPTSFSGLGSSGAWFQGLGAGSADAPDTIGIDKPFPSYIMSSVEREMVLMIQGFCVLDETETRAIARREGPETAGRTICRKKRPFFVGRFDGKNVYDEAITVADLIAEYRKGGADNMCTDCAGTLAMTFGGTTFTGKDQRRAA